MKLNPYHTILLFLTMILFAGCADFDEMNTNPDEPAVASAPWLATEMINHIASTIDWTKGFTGPYQQGKYVLFTERKEGTQYNNLGRASFSDHLTVLRNVEPMNDYALELESELADSYKALGHFVRAWQFFQLTMRVGDIPYSEAILGDEGSIKPRYDSQKDVFLGILNELDQANTLFSRGADFSGDFIYKGNVDQWQRLVNSFELYVLMNLDKKTSDTDLNVIDKFKEVSQRPLMRDFHDNFAVTYNTSKGYAYPWSNTPSDLNNFTQYTMLSATFIDLLKDHEDRRLFYVAEPASALLKQGEKESEFSAYIGVESSDDYNSTIDKKNQGMYSDINDRYVKSATAETAGLLCHWDIEFLLAEAVVRGWIEGDAEAFYANGIKSSMEFYAHFGSEEYNHGVDLGEEYINAYPATVALSGSEENKIRQIISQKYMAGFFHNRYQAWFEHRRTGYPEFILNPNSNMNPTDNTKFPTRWQYPQNEIDFNTENLKEAVERQYNGSDDFNGIMWILKD